MKNWYEYGRKFEQKEEEIKSRRRKRISDQTARGKEYEEMKKRMLGNITKNAIKIRIQGAIKVYELFTEIGGERINRIVNSSVDMVIRLKKEELQQIKEHFRNKSKEKNIQMEE